MDVWTPSIVRSPQFRSAPVRVYYKMQLTDFKHCNYTALRTSHSNAKGHFRAQVTFEATGIKYRESGNHAWSTPPQPATIDGIIDTAGGSEMHSNGAGMEAVVLCDENFNAIFEERQGYAKIFLVLYSLAVATMVVIVAIYIALWTTLNLQGWIKTMFSISLLVSYLMVVLDYAGSLYEYEAIKSGSTGCIVVGVLKHFFGISVYSWLTIICFDLWSTITSMKPPSNRGSGRTKFFLYSLFAYGVPTVTVTVAVIIETSFDLYDDRMVHPLYGQLRCDIDQTADLYHGLPIPLALFLASITFGFLLTKHLYIASKLKIRKNNGDNHQLFFKLFIITGPTLIFEIISSDIVTGGGKVPLIWAVLYVFNALQPCALFWVFVCNAEIKQKLFQKYPTTSGLVAWMKWNKEPTTEAPSTKTTNTDNQSSTGVSNAY